MSRSLLLLNLKEGASVYPNFLVSASRNRRVQSLHENVSAGLRSRQKTLFSASMKWIILTCGLSVSSWALSCNTLSPRTTLEKVYCQLRAQGKGGSFPAFAEFRKNTEATQYAILKREAKVAGIHLPVPISKTPEKPENLISAGVTNSIPLPITAELSHCKIIKDAIDCNGSLYRLLDNLPLSLLARDALDEKNRLHLLPDAVITPLSIKELSEVYTLYVEKMIVIGLAASTMSFTKFVALYNEFGQDNQGFSTRFHDMYELLKKERKQQAIQARYTLTHAHSLAECMYMGGPSSKPVYILCDNIHTNWVYQLDGHADEGKNSPLRK